MSAGKDFDPRFIRRYVSERVKPEGPVTTHRPLKEIKEDPSEREGDEATVADTIKERSFAKP